MRSQCGVGPVMEPQSGSAPPWRGAEAVAAVVVPARRRRGAAATHVVAVLGCAVAFTVAAGAGVVENRVDGRCQSRWPRATGHPVDLQPVTGDLEIEWRGEGGGGGCHRRGRSHQGERAPTPPLGHPASACARGPHAQHDLTAEENLRERVHTACASAGPE